MVYLLSRVVGVVAWVGRVINPIGIFIRVFDWTIGIDETQQTRDDHLEPLVEAVEAHEIEYKVSKQVLIEEVGRQHRGSISQISRGESVLSVSIALIAVFVGELPAAISLPFGISLPLPSITTLLLILSVILVTSVFFRRTAIAAAAFSKPNVFDSYNTLMTKLAWNGGTLKYSRLASNILILQIMKEWDERYYRLTLQIMADLVKDGDFGFREGLNRYWDEIWVIMEDKYRWLSR